MTETQVAAIVVLLERIAVALEAIAQGVHQITAGVDQIGETLAVELGDLNLRVIRELQMNREVMDQSRPTES